MKRDPRIDPVAGDILESPDGLVRKLVISRPRDDTVVYSDSPGIQTSWLTVWQDWAKTAVVVEQREDPFEEAPAPPQSWWRRLWAAIFGWS